jgi:uncharacterized protein (DUF58 family)
VRTAASKDSLAPLGSGSRAAGLGVHLVDPATLMAIRNLELRAKVVVEGFWSGIHRSPYHGFSVEFTEYRPYTPGDDPRYLDWRLYARTDRSYLKKFEDETNLRCYLLVDNSRSMDYGSLAYSKSAYTRTFAATLAYFLYRQGDAVGLLSFDEQVRGYIPARHRGGHLRHLILRLEQPAGGASTDLAAPLERLLSLLKRRSLAILISDLLAPVEALEQRLAALTASGHEVILFQVLDPAEVTFSFERPALFQDLETRADLFVDPAAARQAYLRALETHQQTILNTCRGLGVTWHRLVTDQPLEYGLLAFLKERSRRGRLIRRQPGRRGEA